jgi:hypothetical protein
MVEGRHHVSNREIENKYTVENIWSNYEDSGKTPLEVCDEMRSELARRGVRGTSMFLRNTSDTTIQGYAKELIVHYQFVLDKMDSL